MLAAFGLVACAVGAVLALCAGVGWFAVALGVIAVVALVDLGWALYRRYRGEPG